MNCANIKPEVAFDSEYIPEYKDLHNDIYRRLIHLHTTIIILDKIVKFPLRYFVRSSRSDFWNIVKLNFTDIAVILICGLVTDEGKDKHTLTKFKNEVLKHIKYEFKKSYQENLKEVKYDTEFKRISKKAKEIRNKFIAHRLLKTNTQVLTNDVVGLTLLELEKLFKEIDKLFQASSFGSYYVTTFSDFMEGTIGGKPTQSHLDDIFDLIVKDSSYFNEPEKNSSYWQYIRKKKSSEELKILNDYRKKFGMSEA